MRKQIFVMISSVIMSMSLVGMKQEQQKNGLLLVPEEVIYKATQYCDLQSIGRLKRVCKQFSEYDTVQLMCSSYREFEHKYSYEQYSCALKYCAQKNDTRMFELLYSLHEKRNDELLKKIYDMPYADSIAMIDRRRGYAGRYYNDNGIQAKERVLSKACEQGSLALVMALIENGIDVNAANFGYGIPLHEACQKGFLTIVKFLIGQGADVNAINDRCHYAPLYFACENSNDDLAIIKYLIEKGADISGGFYRHSPLYVACEWNCFAKVKFLVEQGADISDSVFWIACTRGSFEIIEFLIEKGADVNGRDFPFHAVCERGSLSLVKYLIEKGADATRVAKDYYSYDHKEYYHNKRPIDVTYNREVAQFLNKSLSSFRACPMPVERYSRALEENSLASSGRVYEKISLGIDSKKSFVRNIAASLLVLGVGGIGYYFLQKSLIAEPNLE